MSQDEREGHLTEEPPVTATQLEEPSEPSIDWRDTLVNQTEYDRQALTAILSESRQQLAATKARWLVARANGRGLDTQMHPGQLQADAKAWAERVGALVAAVEAFETNEGLPMPSGIEIPAPGTVIPIPNGAA